MPRAYPPRRVHIAVKVYREARERYVAHAARLGIDLSTWQRRALTFAEERMPDDYTEERS